jgi:putative chitinase
MRAQEFIFEDEQLDEGFAQFLAKLGLAAIPMLGAGTGLYIDKLLNRNDITPTQKAAIAIHQNVPQEKLSPEVKAKIPDAQNLLRNLPQSDQAKKDIDSITKPPSLQKLKIVPITGNSNELFLKKFAESRGITGIELAAFMAQCAHESLNFTKMVEMAGGSKYEPKFQRDRKTGRLIIDPKTNKPINYNKDAAKLGNDQPGDGERFKGRGFIQLTGRDNYRMASMFVFGNQKLLEKGNESLAEDPEIAARIAVWYWKERVRPKVDDFKNVRDVTFPINSGLAGLERREKLFTAYLQAASGKRN